MSKKLKGALHKYSTEHFEVSPFDTTGLQGVNPLKCSVVRWLHLKVFNAIQV